ncbi:hypothetical protein AMTRI_Chr10g3750 [Amborella trichopoda]
MPGSRRENSHKKLQKHKGNKKQRICGCFCCNCRLSTSSSDDFDSFDCERGDHFGLGRLSHAMVQERLEQLIQSYKTSRRETKKPNSHEDIYEKTPRVESGNKVMLAMQKFSYDPRKDFRDSMFEVIAENQIVKPKELRSLLDCYLSMNTEECRMLILEAFHEVCLQLFICPSPLPSNFIDCKY